MRACCASLRPKYAKCGCTISSSFSTTVVTPRKWPGRDLPSSRSLNPSTCTYVENPGGYISAASGRNSPSIFAASSFAVSASIGRGYLDKSSFGPNCFGFKNMDAYTGEHSFFALSTSARCPACSAPIVGTNPITRCSNRASFAFSFIHAMVRIVSIHRSPKKKGAESLRPAALS